MFEGQQEHDKCIKRRFKIESSDRIGCVLVGHYCQRELGVSRMDLPFHALLRRFWMRALGRLNNFNFPSTIRTAWTKRRKCIQVHSSTWHGKYTFQIKITSKAVIVFQFIPRRTLWWCVFLRVVLRKLATGSSPHQSRVQSAACHQSKYRLNHL